MVRCALKCKMPLHSIFDCLLLKHCKQNKLHTQWKFLFACFSVTLKINCFHKSLHRQRALLSCIILLSLTIFVWHDILTYMSILLYVHSKKREGRKMVKKKNRIEMRSTKIGCVCTKSNQICLAHCQIIRNKIEKSIKNT